jgi:hypothetical protein
MTWVVVDANRTFEKYMLIGNTCFYGFNITGTTVGGVLSFALQIALPPGLMPTALQAAGCWVFDNAVGVAGIAQVNPAITGVISVLRADIANYAASAGNTAVRGCAVFEVQP